MSSEIDELFNRAARRNEYRISLVRLFGYALTLLIDVVLAALGRREWSNVVSVIPLVVLSGVLVPLTRRSNSKLFRYVIPLVDASFIFTIFWLRIERDGIN